MVLPVFAAAWELECCQPEATVGQAWSACLFLNPPVPWWTEEDDEGASESALGVMELDVDVLRGAEGDEAMALADAGPVCLGVKGLRETGRRLLCGRISSEWHGPGPEGVSLGDVECTGNVRRVRLFPIAFERRGDRAWFPVEELSPVDVRSTGDRRRMRTDDNDRHYRDTLLVDIEVSTTHGPAPEPDR
ncbi:MAG: hypothetical protein ABR511_11920 [Acidimicrobiales bacterium]